ncbi:hypothetical protein P7K49_017345 [Saguinus oedipus]|uniref:Uncharacterized protein n=1 Tax=Saguinus oedipus TaxID=9490 RepID=A0ABQ9V284_SAGOE|nr:hypothetical protein P7K49_017345 [Saguinus oedipus]
MWIEEGPEPPSPGPRPHTPFSPSDGAASSKRGHHGVPRREVSQGRTLQGESVLDPQAPCSCLQGPDPLRFQGLREGLGLQGDGKGASKRTGAAHKVHTRLSACPEHRRSPQAILSACPEHRRSPQAILSTCPEHRRSPQAILSACPEHRQSPQAILRACPEHRRSPQAILSACPEHRRSPQAILSACPAHRRSPQAILSACPEHRRSPQAILSACPAHRRSPQAILRGSRVCLVPLWPCSLRHTHQFWVPTPVLQGGNTQALPARYTHLGPTSTPHILPFEVSNARPGKRPAPSLWKSPLLCQPWHALARPPAITPASTRQRVDLQWPKGLGVSARLPPFLELAAETPELHQTPMNPGETPGSERGACLFRVTQQIPETVLYLHFRPEAWSDAFSLDVASGLGAPLEGVRVELEVLPAAIPLEAQNFSVPEGGSHTLAPPLLHVTGPYFPTLPGLSLQVLEPPRHGALQKEDGPQARTLSAFSWREVEEQVIRYVHDGSETLTDGFVLMANTSETDRQSHPVAFTVAVLPVNDQPPVLTTNTALQQVKATAWLPKLLPLVPQQSRAPIRQGWKWRPRHGLEPLMAAQVVLLEQKGPAFTKPTWQGFERQLLGGILPGQEPLKVPQRADLGCL